MIDSTGKCNNRTAVRPRCVNDYNNNHNIIYNNKNNIE